MCPGYDTKHLIGRLQFLCITPSALIVNVTKKEKWRQEFKSWIKLFVFHCYQSWYIRWRENVSVASPYRLASCLECSPMAAKAWVQSQVESYQRLKKIVLDATLLNTQHFKVRIKDKVEQSGKGVAPYPTPLCSSYLKGRLRVTLDNRSPTYGDRDTPE